MVYRKGKRIDGRDLSEQGNCELFCLGTKLMKRANAPRESCETQGALLVKRQWHSPEELRSLRKGPKKTGKEGWESRNWAHPRPKETPIRESYRKGRTDHATWQICGAYYTKSDFIYNVCVRKRINRVLYYVCLTHVIYNTVLYIACFYWNIYL